MKKFRAISIVVLVLSVISLLLWRAAVSFPDWLVRVVGALAIISLFTSVFSTVKMLISKNINAAIHS
jgi:hypothetical protein